MDKLLTALLVISQTIIFPNLSFRWAKEVSVQIFIILMLSWLIWKKNKYISLFLVWSLFSFIIYKGILINDVGLKTTYQFNFLSILTIINIILYGFFYYMLHQVKINKEKIYKTLCFIAIFQSIYVIIQKMNLDQFFYQISHLTSFPYKNISWPVGTWANEALVSWLIAICSPFFLYFNKLRYKIGYGVCGIAILCTMVTTSIVAYLLGFLFWLFFKHRKVAVILTLLVLVTGAIISQNDGIYNRLSDKLEYFLRDTHRFQVWKKSLELWRPNTIIGNGLGSFRALFALKSPEFASDGYWAQAHNDYIQILFQQGIVGLGIILCLMWTTFYNFWKKRVGLIPITSLVIFSMIAFWGFPTETAMFIIPLLSLIMFEKDVEELDGT